MLKQRRKPIEDWLATTSPTELGSYKRLHKQNRLLTLAALIAGAATVTVFAVTIKGSGLLSIIFGAPMLGAFLLVWKSMDNTSRKLISYYEIIFAGLSPREKKLLYVFNCFRASDLLQRHMKEEKRHAKAK